MIILLPMGGFGSRFKNAGYDVNKPCIPTFDRHSGAELPMVVCAMKDMLGAADTDTKIVCVNRDFHQTDGTEQTILEHFPQTIFIHDHVLLDQAFACFLARTHLDVDEPLFIGACDNGFDIDISAFEECCRDADVVMLSHSGDANIARDPNAHSWAVVSGDDDNTIDRISIKKTVSQDFLKDHATTGMFWFKSARVFLNALDELIWQGNGPREKHLVDSVLQVCIDRGLKVKFHDVQYHCWGTPADYENYQNTAKYWIEYTDANPWM